MNKLILRSLVLSLSLFVLASESNAQWVAQTIGGTQSLRSLQMLDQITGWAAGSGSTLLSTLDGSSWAASQTGFSGNYTSITFSDPIGIDGYIVGDMPEILRTTDGGFDWVQASSGTTNALNSVHFATQTDSGWAAGNGGTIVATTDAGATWHKQNTPVTSTLYSIRALNAFAVWAVGDQGTVLNTTNGGTTWVKQSFAFANTFYAIDMVDYLNGWIVGDQIILHTKDGGASWVKQTFSAPTTLRAIIALDTADAYAAGANGRILYTTNGGTTWTDETSGFTQNIYSLQFTSDGSAWAACDNGTLLKNTVKQAVAAPVAPVTSAALSQNYPNPFSATTSIQYELTRPGDVEVAVYDQLGRLVRTLVSGAQSAGRHVVRWDRRSDAGAMLPAGLYFCELSLQGPTQLGTQVRKMLVSR